MVICHLAGRRLTGLPTIGRTEDDENRLCSVNNGYTASWYSFKLPARRESQNARPCDVRAGLSAVAHPAPTVSGSGWPQQTDSRTVVPYFGERGSARTQGRKQ